MRLATAVLALLLAVHCTTTFATGRVTSGTCSSPLRIDQAPDGTEISEIAARTDRSGNAVVFWFEKKTDAFEAKASRFSPGWGWGFGKGWKGPVTLAHSRFKATYSMPVVLLDQDGTSLALWKEADHFGNLSLVASHGAPSGSWGQAAALDVGDIDIEALSGPKAAIDASGNALVVWQYNGRLAFTRHSRGGSWTPLQVTDFKMQPIMGRMELGMTPDGRALLTWVEDPKASYAIVIGYLTGNVMSSELPRGSFTWSAPQLVRAGDDNNQNTVSDITFAMGDSGTARVAWFDAKAGTLSSARYLWRQSQWAPEELVDDGSGLMGISEYPTLTIGADGRTDLLWTQYSSSPDYSEVIGRTLSPGGSWSDRYALYVSEFGHLRIGPIARNDAGSLAVAGASYPGNIHENWADAIWVAERPAGHASWDKPALVYKTRGNGPIYSPLPFAIAYEGPRQLLTIWMDDLEPGHLWSCMAEH